MMKKVIALLLTAVLCCSMVACKSQQDSGQAPGTNASNGGETAKAAVTYYKLGDTVSTDIFEFTLNSAEYTLALNNVTDETYFTPKEYDATKDNNNPYVAPVGHTYAAFSYTVTNLDRASGKFHEGSFATVTYEGKDYDTVEEGAYFIYADKYIKESSGYATTLKAGEWRSKVGSNFLLMAGEKETRRAYIDVAADIKDLNADVTITVAVPASDGKKTEFTYLITEQDRNETTHQEIDVSLDLALSTFTAPMGQEYFKKHLEEYPVLTAEELANVASGKRKVEIKMSYGSWKGTFWFQDDGKIKDDYGYVNKRTWELVDNQIIFDGDTTCEARKVKDRVYLFVSDGNPYLLMQP